MKVHHRGQTLNQEQLDAIVPVMNNIMHGKISEAQFEEEVDRALREAGCPVSPTRSEWEGSVIDKVSDILDIKHSDACGVVDAQAFSMAQAWAAGLDDDATANKIIAESEK